MSDAPALLGTRGRSPRSLLLLLLVVALLHCSSGSDSANECFPDADGRTGGAYTLSLTVDDEGFSKTVLNTQNNATITLTLTNAGTLPHGFELDCVDVTSEFPHQPPGCPSTSCFPDASTIPPLAPGESQTVTFVTPTTDNVIYPFHSNAPDDGDVPGLNGGQWSLM